jgi:hypothetical protein
MPSVFSSGVDSLNRGGICLTAKQEEFYHNKAEMREHGKKKGHQMDPYRLINISAVTSHLEILVFSFG